MKATDLRQALNVLDPERPLQTDEQLRNWFVSRPDTSIDELTMLLEDTDLPHAVIFWVGQYGLRELATDAPDFWAWRSGVFDFRSEQFERPATAMSAFLREGSDFQDRGDLERNISLYRGLLEEQGRQERPDEAFVARLRTRMSRAFRWLGRFKEAEALAHLGSARAEMGRLDEAERSFKDSLEIQEGIGDESRLAGSYHNLGVIAQKRERLDEAEKWYRKSLEIRERLGLERNAAFGYHQMGIVAQERGRLDEAEEWYGKSLEIFERLGLERYAADGYHNLGTVAHERGRLAEAERWYRKSRKIWESLGLERSAALGYHNLGMIAQERGRLDEAERWYRKSLEIWESLGNRPDMVDTLTQMGVLRRKQNRGRESVSLLGRALAIATEHKMKVGGPVLLDLARVALDIGEEEFESAWREAFEDQEPPMKELGELVEKIGPRQTATSPEPSP